MRRVRCALGIRVLVTLVLSALALAPPGARAGHADVDGEVCVSPRHGYTLTYDPDDWSIAFEDDNPTDRFDRVFFSNGPSLFSLTGHPDYGSDKMVECAGDFERGVGGLVLVSAVVPLDDRGAAGGDAERASIEPLETSGASGGADGRAWATIIYVWEFREGAEAEFVQYYECIWRGDGVTAVVLHEVNDTSYDEEIALRESFVAGIAPADRGSDASSGAISATTDSSRGDGMPAGRDYVVAAQAGIRDAPNHTG